MSGALELRPLAGGEHASFHQCAAVAFHESVDDNALARWARVEEQDRSWAVFDCETMVATGLAYRCRCPSRVARSAARASAG
jgi:hypothetical protein